MGFNIISAAEAASYIKHGYNIGLSGFTPAGTPKAVTPEVAKMQKKNMPKVTLFKLVSLPVLLQEMLQTASYPGSRQSVTVLLTQPTPISEKP